MYKYYPKSYLYVPKQEFKNLFKILTYYYEKITTTATGISSDAIANSELYC